MSGGQSLDRYGGDQVEHQVQLRTPSPVHRRLADARAARDALDGHPGVADGRELLEDGGRIASVTSSRSTAAPAGALRRGAFPAAPPAASAGTRGVGVRRHAFSIGRDDETVAFRRQEAIVSRCDDTVPSRRNKLAKQQLRNVKDGPRIPPPSSESSGCEPGPPHTADVGIPHRRSRGARRPVRPHRQWRPPDPAGVRPPALGHARHFITAFATAKLTAQYSQAKLGQVWQVANPLLNAAVYYFIFGVLLGTKHGVRDFVPFLVTGVFIWTFTQSSIMAGTRAISGSLGLVRALHFPRAALPVSYAIQQLQQLLFSMAALVVILLCFGIPVSTSWLLVVPILTLQFVFNAGVAMIMARMGAKTPDIAQLMPFVLRTGLRLRCHVEHRLDAQAQQHAALGDGRAGEQPGRRLHRPDALRAP